MQLSGMPYNDVMIMPVFKVNQYLKWKNRFDEEVARRQKEELEK